MVTKVNRRAAMNYNEIIKLLDAGYSREEILQMDEKDHNLAAQIFKNAGICYKKLGDYVGDKFQILGGVILILIGIKILLGF